MPDSVEMRSSASRSEMSRTWSDTRRSRGGFQVGFDARTSELLVQVCALPMSGANTTAVASVKTKAKPRRRSTCLLLGARDRLRGPVEDRDISLPFNAGTQ